MVKLAIHAALRWLWGQPRAGSSPVPGTKLFIIKKILCLTKICFLQLHLFRPGPT